MAIREVTIDPRTWRTASELRRAELRAAIADLTDADSPAIDGVSHLLVAVDDHAIRIEGRGGDDASVARVEVPHDAIEPHLREYLDICRQMQPDAENARPNRFEVLDMAKKVVHDRAARALMPLCAPLGAGRDACRRIWALIVPLVVDTPHLATRGLLGRY